MAGQFFVSSAILDIANESSDISAPNSGTMPLLDYFKSIYDGMSDNQRRQYDKRAKEAQGHILQYPMFTETEVVEKLGYSAEAFGSKLDNNECVDLVYLPTDEGRMFPQFQFDVDRRDVNPAVRVINVFLDAQNDPWGVASWWMHEHGRIGFPPCELLNGKCMPERLKNDRSWVEILVMLAEDLRYNCSF